MHPEVPDDDDLPRRSDIRLMRRAIRERWPIPEDVRVKVLQALANIVAGGLDDEPLDPLDELRRPDPRAIVAAAKALIDADKLNMEQEKRDLAIPEHHVHEHRYAAMSDAELIAEATRAAGGAAPPRPADPA